MAIAVKLDDLLHDRRMTLTEFAERIGMALPNLSILKTGKARAPSASRRSKRFARRSRASPPTFSGLSLSKQKANDRQRRAKGAQANERPAEGGGQRPTGDSGARSARTNRLTVSRHS